MPHPWTVTIEELGRGGTVRYRETEGVIACDWEFSGGDTIASIRVGTEAEWRASHPWAVARRAQIVDRIGGDVIRQRAPSCRYELDERGWMHLVASGADVGAGSTASSSFGIPPANSSSFQEARTSGAASAEFVRRLSGLRAKVAVGIGVAATVVGATLWLGRSALSIETTGTRFGDSVRAGNTIATLIQRLEPYVPSPHRDASKDRYSMGILLHSTDGSTPPTFVAVSSDHAAGSLQNSRFLGVDSERIWFRAPEVGALDRRTTRVLDDAELAAVIALAPTPSGNLADLATGDRALLLHLTAGGLVSPTRFMALLTHTEATRDFKPNSTAKAIVEMEQTSEPRLLWFGDVERDGTRQRLTTLVELAGASAGSSVGGSSAIPSHSAASHPVSASPVASLFHAGFLRASRNGALLQLSGPDSVLRIHHPDRYRTGTAVLARLDLNGAVLWELDLGIAALEQILPDPERPAFIGTKPATPGKVPEAILVIVDTATGAAITHALP